MSNNNDNNISSSNTRNEYRGPVKLSWVDGRQIMRPDLESVSSGSHGALQSYFVGKTLDDVISETDETQFSKLKDDIARYQMVMNMITGVETKTNPPFRVTDGDGGYVHGEYRDLRTILIDLIEKKKIWLDPTSGNIFEYNYAIREKLIKFPCRNCSKVLYSEEERTRHSYSHMARQTTR
jgi:hypothetical protein